MSGVWRIDGPAGRTPVKGGLSVHGEAQVNLPSWMGVMGARDAHPDRVSAHVKGGLRGLEET